jgi:hypothetical protein
MRQPGTRSGEASAGGPPLPTPVRAHRAIRRSTTVRPVRSIAAVRRSGLPPAHSGHMSTRYWGPAPAGTTSVLGVGFDPGSGRPRRRPRAGARAPRIGARVQRSGRHIGKDDLGADHERPGGRDPLLWAVTRPDGVGSTSRLSVALTASTRSYGHRFRAPALVRLALDAPRLAVDAADGAEHAAAVAGDVASVQGAALRG